ncbi:hypothetical protein [uncultured Amnibacterium sp.]|uniref:hypothetical protein n=1 Tax=uncultured Amnibacterium sp. TaxID=1631851 RepID=UPI0035CBD3E7
MTLLYEFLRYWEPACERKDLPKLLAEVAVADGVQSQAARVGREFLLACALGPWETDDVLSEIALLTVADSGDETWQLRRLSGPQAAVVAGGRLSAHFAKSFILATWIRQPPRTRQQRTAPGSVSTD